MKILALLFFLPALLKAETFIQDCKVIGEDDFVQFKITSTVNEHSELKLTISAFEDEKCKQQYLEIERNFRIQKIDGLKIDLETESIVYTPLTIEVAKAMNLISYCGIRKWTAHSKTDVSGKKCDEYEQLSKGAGYFQIVSVTPQQLQWGQESSERNARTIEGRPLVFEKSAFYSK